MNLNQTDYSFLTYFGFNNYKVNKGKKNNDIIAPLAAPVYPP